MTCSSATNAVRRLACTVTDRKYTDPKSRPRRLRHALTFLPMLSRWHEGETCAEYQHRKKKQNEVEEKASLKKIKESCKDCPSCKKKIEKVGGCDQMTCKCKRCMLYEYPFDTHFSSIQAHNARPDSASYAW